VDYRHTQTSYTSFLVGAGALVVFAIMFAAGDEGTGTKVLTGAVVLLLVVVTVLFNRLTVVVANGVVEVKFGFGWPRRTMETRDIVAARQVRNQWYYGFGMRKVPGGWMYNVWGLDAVEVELRSGSTFRIGTDEPGDLQVAITLHASLRRDAT